MKAAVYERYGPANVVELKEVARPEIKDDEVLVKVYATTVSTADWRIRASAFPAITWLMGRAMFGLFAPRNRVLGAEFAGRVVSVGDKVTRFKLGDAVFGMGKSTHAEYLAMPEGGSIAPLPAGIGYEDAAAVPFGALSALVFLRDYAKVRPGQKVLINGASGGVGVHAVQLAKHFGAEVTAVTSTDNVELVRSLGADRVIDYRNEDFTRSGEFWDAVVDPVGKSKFADVKRVLKPDGVYVPLEFALTEIVQALMSSLSSGPKIRIGISGDSREDLEFVASLLQSGDLRPVIDSRLPLAQIADAHRRVESRHKTGSVVVTLRPNEATGIAAAA